jgi:hypothetical protein
LFWYLDFANPESKCLVAHEKILASLEHRKLESDEKLKNRNDGSVNFSGAVPDAHHEEKATWKL